MKCTLLLALSLLCCIKAPSQVSDSIPNAHGMLHCVKSYAAPVLITTYGVIAIGPSTVFYDRFDARKDVQNRFPGFHSTADNYLQFVPAATVFSLSLAGVKGKHNFIDQLFLYAGSMALSEGLATALKYTTRVLRPDGSSKNSFPSGHTTSAFTGAELLNQEYGRTSILYSIFGYILFFHCRFLLLHRL